MSVFFDVHGNLYVNGAKKRKTAATYPATLAWAIGVVEKEGRGWRPWMGQDRDYLTFDLPGVSFKCKHTGQNRCSYGMEPFLSSSYQLRIDDVVLEIGKTWIRVPPTETGVSSRATA